MSIEFIGSESLISFSLSHTLSPLIREAKRKARKRQKASAMAEWRQVETPEKRQKRLQDMSGWQTVQLQEETSEQMQKRLHKKSCNAQDLATAGGDTRAEAEIAWHVNAWDLATAEGDTRAEAQRRLHNMSMHETLRLQETPEQRQRRLQDKSHCVRLYDYRRRHQSRNRRGCSVCHHGRMLDYQHKLNRSDKTGKGMNQLARGNYIAN